MNFEISLQIDSLIFCPILSTRVFFCRDREPRDYIFLKASLGCTKWFDEVGCCRIQNLRPPLLYRKVDSTFVTLVGNVAVAELQQRNAAAGGCG